METNTQVTQATNDGHSNTEIPVEEQQNNTTSAEKKKYHSSAMYAANVWRSTMQHVKHHQNHTGLNL